MRTLLRVFALWALSLLPLPAALAVPPGPMVPRLDAQSPRAAQAAGVLRGRVRSEGTGAPLPYATVQWTAAGHTRSVMTDALGGYLVRDVPAGRGVLRARHIGHRTLEVGVLVPAGGEVWVDLSLEAEPVPLEPIVADGRIAFLEGDTLPRDDALEAGPIGVRVLQTSPGLTELGLGDAVRPPPGQAPVDPADVLYVRGAAADLKLVYLDGAPVYSPFPVGGLLEAFPARMLSSAELYRGGAPARYDGGLSYVLDLNTRALRRDRVRTEVAMDLLSARGSVESPLPGGAALLLAGRGAHGRGADLLGTPLPYGYREGFARADLPLAGGRLSAMGFANREAVWFGAPGVADSAIHWSNAAGSLRYRALLGGTQLELTGAAGDFAAHLPLVGGDAVRVVDGRSRRLRLAADLGRGIGPAWVRYGASYDRQRQGYRTFDVLPGRREAADPVQGQAALVGAYVDAAWQADPRLRLRGGLRADYATLGGSMILAPRLAATWMVGDRASLTLSAGQYHQYLRVPETQVVPTGAFAADTLVVPDAALALGRASHFGAALDHEVADGVRVGMEGFFKRFRDLPAGGSTDATASGADFWVQRAAGALTGWVGYSLAWVWTDASRQQPGDFAGRHLLTAGLDAPFGEQVGLSLRLAYGAGLPYSAVPLPGRPEFDAVGASPGTSSAGAERSMNSAPLLPRPDEPYLRLDLSASRSWLWRQRSSELRFTPYVRVLNALDRRDALFYRYQPHADGGLEVLAALPLVPVLGLEVAF